MGFPLRLASAANVPLDYTPRMTVLTAQDLASALRGLPDLAILIDGEGMLVWVNDALGAVLQLDPADWTDRPVLDVVHPDDHALVASSIAAVAHKPRGTPIEIRVRDGSGAWRLVEVLGAWLEQSEGAGLIACVVRDLTERRMWEIGGNDLNRVQRIMQHAASIVMLLDVDGDVATVNGAFGRLLGHDPTLVVGHPLTEFVAGDEAPLVDAALAAARAGNGAQIIELHLLDQNGRPVPARLEIASLIDDPVINGFVVTGSDVTELRASRTKLEYLATHDPLTGLYNRARLVQHLEDYVQNAHRHASLAFIDLDRFKPINDIYGHAAGDDALLQVAQRLLGAVRPSDMVARMGGDEFVVLAPGLTNAEHVSTFARRLAECFETPFDVKADRVRIGASIGCVTTSRESTVASVLAEADRAMYVDKASQDAGATHTRDHSSRRHRLATEIGNALENGQIVPYLQPVVTLKTGDRVGYEALARWEHPDFGTLGPGSFLGVMDATGLQDRLGDCILQQALAAVAQLPGQPWLSINLANSQLADARLCGRIGDLLLRHGLAPDRLAVEITESAVLSERRPASGLGCDEAVRRLHRAGVQIVLDDFGAGISSLTHLRRLPLAWLKIDGSFVRGVDAHGDDRRVVKGVIDLAHALGLCVVAEGVETEAERRTLDELGCDLGQGYLFSPAVPVDALLTRAGRSGPAARAR
jgi:diguanylate cyclase (GGDEF)-like protein/PAS domain S-box-containing protein